MPYTSVKGALQGIADLEEALDSLGVEMAQLFNHASDVAASTVKVFGNGTSLQSMSIYNAVTDNPTIMSLAELNDFATRLGNALTAMESVVAVGRTMADVDSGGENLVDFLVGLAAGKAGVVAGTVITGVAVTAGAPALAAFAIGVGGGYLIYNLTGDILSDAAEGLMIDTLIQKAGESIGWAIYEAGQGVQWLTDTAADILEDIGDFAGRNRIGAEGDDYFTLAGDHNTFGGFPVEVFALGGSDQIYGGKAVDVIYAGEGDDRVESAALTIFGGGGNDTIEALHPYQGTMVEGGAGDDLLTGRNVDYDGGTGFDTFMRADATTLAGISFSHRDDGGWQVYANNTGSYVRNVERVQAADGTSVRLPVAVSEMRLVNTTTDGAQRDSRFAVLNNGDRIFVWTDASESDGDTSETQVRGRIMDAALLDGGVEFRVNTTTSGFQRLPDVAVLENGNFVVAWQNIDASYTTSQYTTARFQVFDRNGNAIGSEGIVTNEGDRYQEDVQVVSLATGGFMVFWHDGHPDSRSIADRSGGAIMGQAYDASGNRVGGAFQVNDSNSQSERDLSVTQLENGGFALAWTENGSTIHSQLFDAEGKALGPERVPGAGQGSGQFWPEVVATADGGYMVLWSDTASGYRTLMQRYSASGAAMGGVVVVSETDHASKSGFALEDGRTVLLMNESLFVVDSDGASVSPMLFGMLDPEWGQATGTGQGIDMGNGTFMISWNPDYRYTSADWLDEDYESVVGQFFDLSDDTPQIVSGGISGDALFGRTSDDDLSGGAGDDSLYGGAGNDRLDGGEGADSLMGGDGDDTIEGGDSGDLVDAGRGNDSIDGGAGDDDISGGVGEDSAEGGAGADLIRGGPGADTLKGGDGDDAIRGQSDGDHLEGGAGADNVKGGGGNDTLQGDDGNDYLKGGSRKDDVSGGNDDDKLFGNSFDDRLDGGAGNDVLNAGGENDVLIGGTGDDTLKGGDGADVFIFARGDGADRILDFDLAEDTLVISAGLSVDQIVAAADVVSGSLLLDLGDGQTIELRGIDTTDGLAGVIDVF